MSHLPLLDYEKNAGPGFCLNQFQEFFVPLTINSELESLAKQVNHVSFV